MTRGFGGAVRGAVAGLAMLALPVAAGLGVTAYAARDAAPAAVAVPLPAEPVALVAQPVAEPPAPAPKAEKPVPVVAKPAPAPAAEPFVIKRILKIEGPIRFGEWHWDDAGVPEGAVAITVDLEAQTLSVFRGGYEIGATAILYGADDKPTPLGTYPITQKKKHHISNLYNAPMPYMQRLTNDGISIHGSEVEGGYATHGCVGVPNDFAKKLFEVTKLGDRVIITRGKRIGVGSTITGK